MGNYGIECPKRNVYSRGDNSNDWIEVEMETLEGTHKERWDEKDGKGQKKITHQKDGKTSKSEAKRS